MKLIVKPINYRILCQRYFRYLSFAILPTLFLTSCNITKHLPAKERLYVGTDIRVKADSSVSKSDKGNLTSGLEGLARPRPNKILFGYPYKVALYYLLGEPKSENGFRAWFRNKLGEPPVYASSKAISSNAIIWAAYLENEGYFRSTVSGKLVEKGYKARGVYDVNVQPRYYIDSVTFLVDSTPVRKAMFTISPRSLLKRNDPYRLDIIKAERERINQTLKNRGFFYFQPDYVGILADTARNSHRLRLYVAIKPDMPLAAGQPYYIRNLYVYPKYSLNDLSRNDTNRSQAYIARDTSLRRVYIVDSARLYKSALFNDILALKPGRRYSSRGHDLTLSRFINVGSFKFVRNRFAPTVQNDTAFLDVHYYLTPYPKRSVKFELDGVTRSNGLAGSQLILSWLNRNFMGRSELLTINGTAGVDFQLGGGTQGTRNFRYGGNAILSFPRLVSPLRFRYDQRQLLPKTLLTVGFERIIQGVPNLPAIYSNDIPKGKLYSLNSYNASFGYSWRKNQRIEQSFIPFGINYVFLKVNDDAFFPLLINPDTRPFYQNLYFNSDQLILNSLYTVSINSSPRTASPHTYRVQFSVEPSGNVASLIFPKDSSGIRRIGENSISQYLRSDIDLRYYYRATPTTTWANRLFVGVGNPYGNSNMMPPIKQYFVGGSNSLRGFRARAIGPGIYTRDTTGVVPLFFDGGGDVKFEVNTELRPKFTKYIQGAVFIDAGNVWMFREEGLYGPGSKFSKNFLKQLAVSGGLGLRVDLSYFLIRVDLGTPLRKPYLTDGKYWVVDKINFRDRYWRRQNLILNIAVGYPF